MQSEITACLLKSYWEMHDDNRRALNHPEILRAGLGEIAQILYQWMVEITSVEIFCWLLSQGPMLIGLKSEFTAWGTHQEEPMERHFGGPEDALCWILTKDSAIDIGP